MKQFEESDFPPAMQSLGTEMRGRAIEEANRLLELGYTSGRATSMGIARAQGKDEQRSTSGGATPAFHVMFAEREWVIWPEDADEPTHRFSTMEDAFRRAHQLAVEHGADLYVFGPGGELIEKNEMDGAGVGGDADTLQVAPYEGGWAVQRTGPERLFERFPTKREAVAMARDRAKEIGARLVIRYSTGKVQEQHDYSGER